MLRLVIETKLLLAPHYFALSDLTTHICGYGTPSGRNTQRKSQVSSVAVKRYVNHLLRLGVVITLHPSEGEPLYFQGPAAAAWFREVPKTRPGGSSGRYKAQKANRDAREHAAWRERIAIIKGTVGPRQTEPMEM
jgi:hypothetical protein